MQGALEKLVEQNAQQAAQISALIDQNASLTAQLSLLQKKIQFLLGRMFGRKSEKLNRDQLEFLLAGLEGTEPDDDPSPTPPPTRKRQRREHKPRMPEDLPTEEQVIIPDSVEQDPSAYHLSAARAPVCVDHTPWVCKAPCQKTPMTTSFICATMLHG